MQRHMPAVDPGSWRWFGLLLLASSLLVSILYLTAPPIFETEDWVKLHSINQSYLARSVAQGRLPLWNPHVALGRPFLADIEVAAFYPPHLLYLFLDQRLALVLLLVGHVGLQLAGNLLLGRALGMHPAAAWLAAVGFAGGGMVAGTFHAGQVPYGEALCWLPLLLWLSLDLGRPFERRRLALLGLALALQFLCGHPQAAWLSWLGLASFLLGRALPNPRALAAAWAGLALALTLAALLVACQLLPFLELVGQGNRSTPSAAFSSVGALRWLDWATLFLPTWPTSRFIFGPDLFLGATLTLAGLAGLSRVADRNVRGLALMAAVAVLFTLGQNTPLWPLFYHAVPGASSFRFPGRAGVLACFALVLSAGSFLSLRRSPLPAKVILVTAGVASVAGGSLWAQGLSPGGGPPLPWLWPSLALLSTVTLLGWTLRSHVSAVPRLALQLALVALVSLELGVTTWIHRPFQHTISRYPGERLLAAVLSDEGLADPSGTPIRVMVPFPVIRDNAGMVLGFSNVAGYGSLTLEATWVYLHESLGLAAPESDNTYPSFDIYDSGPFSLPQAGVAVGLDQAAGRFVRSPASAPRTWLASRTESVSDIHAAAGRLRAGQPRDVATFVGPAEGLPRSGPAGAADGARITRFAPERVEIEARASSDAVLVLAEAWYPGWTATVNGTPAACRPVNGWMRGVAIPPGRSRVVIEYRSTWLRAGAAASALAGVALVLLLLGRPRSAAADPLWVPTASASP